MKTVATLGGEGRGRYDSSSYGFITALQEGERAFEFLDTDVPWFDPVNLADYGGGAQLGLRGRGYLLTNIQKNYVGDLPMLYDWRNLRWPQWYGINWLGQVNLLTGKPLLLDRGPLTSFAYVDQFSIRDVAWMGASGNNCEWGVIGDGTGFGYIAEGTFDHIAVHRAGQNGMVVQGGRNLTIGGHSAFERNGLIDPVYHHGLAWVEDPAAQAIGASAFRDINFEHDDFHHTGLYVRGGRVLTVGPNRYVQCGYDIEASNSQRVGAEVMYGMGQRRFSGTNNKDNGTYSTVRV